MTAQTPTKSQRVEQEKSISLPHCKRPCQNCPFRKDSLKGWLGAVRMSEIIKQGSFVCHKKNHLQCAGHMLLNGDRNDFVQMAARMNIPLPLTGKHLIFDTPEQCIAHHS